MRSWTIRPRSFLDAGFDPVYTILFHLYPLTPTKLLSDFHQFEGAGVNTADFQWTGSISAGFQEAFRAVVCSSELAGFWIVLANNIGLFWCDTGFFWLFDGNRRAHSLARSK